MLVFIARLKFVHHAFSHCLEIVSGTCSLSRSLLLLVRWCCCILNFVLPVSAIFGCFGHLVPFFGDENVSEICNDDDLNTTAIVVLLY